MVKKYCIQYKRTIEKHYSKRIECTHENKTQYNIFGLRPWTQYTMRVSAETVRRGPWSEERISRTNESGKWEHKSTEYQLFFVWFV